MQGSDRDGRRGGAARRPDAKWQSRTRRTAGPRTRGLYEVDRREKSNSETVRVLSDQFAGQLAASERRLQFLMGQIQVLESRLKKLEDDLRVRVRPAGP